MTLYRRLVRGAVLFFKIRTRWGFFSSDEAVEDGEKPPTVSNKARMLVSRHSTSLRKRSAPKTYYHFSDAETKIWLEAWRATRNALEDAKLIFEQESKNDRPETAAELQVKIGKLKEQISVHNRLKLAFYLNEVAIVPPEEDGLIKIAMLADRVDELVGSSDVTHAEMLVADIVKRFDMAMTD